MTNLITTKEYSSLSSCKKSIKRVSIRQRYSYYSKIGHNSCTCKVEIEDAEDSNKSEKQKLTYFNNIK